MGRAKKTIHAGFVGLLIPRGVAGDVLRLLLLLLLLPTVEHLLEELELGVREGEKGEDEGESESTHVDWSCSGRCLQCLATGEMGT